jgi:thioredoxin 1|tara:strand:+ start:1243 stop:1488 length:246 start_codon:yes stop_codon:yes gene_type:complete
MKTIKYFSATWCGPCKTFKPVMNEVAGEGHSVQFIDIDQSQDLAAKYNVRSVPTTVIEDNGIEVDRFVGSVSKQQVLSKLL